jgi:hypothetical protein
MRATFGSFQVDRERHVIDLDSSDSSMEMLPPARPLARKLSVIDLCSSDEQDENTAPVTTIYGPLSSQTTLADASKKSSQVPGKKPFKRTQTLDEFFPATSKASPPLETDESQASCSTAALSICPPSTVTSLSQSTQASRKPLQPTNALWETGSRKEQKEEILVRLKRLPHFHWKRSPNGLIPPKKRIFTACSVQLAQELASLRQEKHSNVLGFDMEWNFHKGSKFQHRTGVIQISSRDTVLIFQVSQRKNDTLPPCLLELLSDETVLKVGVNVKGDAQKLHRDFPDFPPVRGLFELSHLVKRTDTSRWAHRTVGNGLVSLQELAGEYLDCYLEKGDERTSNWEKNLTDKQLDCKSSSRLLERKADS